MTRWGVWCRKTCTVTGERREQEHK